MGDTLLVIASQINQGKESIEKNNEMCISMAKVNLAAGKKAIDSCRHKTASSYLETALSLLPDNHWSSNYDLSLQLSFIAAIAANSSFKCDESEILLKKIFEEGHSMKDKLPSYHLLVTSECLGVLLTLSSLILLFMSYPLLFISHLPSSIFITR